MSIQFYCPCGKKLQAPEKMSGKLVGCPQCGQKMNVPGVASPQPPTTPQPPPPARQYAPTVMPLTHHSSQLAKKSSSVQLLVILLAAIILPMMLCVAGVGFWWLASSQSALVGGAGNNSVDLSYLPENIQLLEHARIAAAAETPIGQQLLNSSSNLPSQILAIENTSGLELANVDSVTVAYLDPTSEKKLPGGFTLQTSGALAFCGVVRLNKDYDQGKILQLARSKAEKTHEGNTYYQVELKSAAILTQKLAVYFPDNRTIIYGTENEVKLAIEQGAKQNRNRKFDAIDAEDHFVMAMVVDEEQPVVQGQSLKLSDQFDHRTWTEFGSKTAAQRAKAGQDFVTGSGQKMMEQMQGFSDSFNMPAEMSEKFKKDTNDMMSEFQGEVEVSGSVLETRRSGGIDHNTSTGFLASLVKDLIPAGIEHQSLAVNRSTNSSVDGKRADFDQAKHAFQEKMAELAKAKSDANSSPKPSPQKSDPIHPEPKAVAAVAERKFSPMVAGEGHRIDLLELISLERDVLKGKWHKANGKLVCETRSFVPRVQIPYIPPKEYDYIVEFEQENLRNHINLIMPNPVNDESIAWQAGGSSQEFVFSVNRSRNNPSNKKVPGLIKPDQRHTLIVQVRDDSVTGIVDGHVISIYETDFSDLAADNWQKIRDTRLLALSCDDPTTFHKIEIVEVSGHGEQAK